MSQNIIINSVKFIFLLFIIASCSTLVEDENMNKNNVIYKIRSVDSNFSNLETLLFVDIDTQSLLHIKKGTVLKYYSISSSYYGTGSIENSLKSTHKERNKYSSGSKQKFYKKNRNHSKSKRVFSEDFDVIVDGNIITSEKESDIQDDQRFNTEKHHKQQHKF